MIRGRALPAALSCVATLALTAGASAATCPPRMAFPPQTAAAIRSAAIPAIGRVYALSQSGEAYGAAALIDVANGLALTAAHVALDAAKGGDGSLVYLQFDGQPRKAARQLLLLPKLDEDASGALDRPRDVALLKIDDPSGLYSEIELSPRYVEDGEGHYIFGYAGAPGAPTSGVGMPAQQGDCTYQLRVAAASSDSGGPVLDAEARLVGVLIQSIGFGETQGRFVPSQCFAQEIGQRLLNATAEMPEPGEKTVLMPLRAHASDAPPQALAPPPTRHGPWIRNLDLIRFVHEWSANPSDLGLRGRVLCYLRNAVSERLGVHYHEKFLETEFAYRNSEDAAQEAHGRAKTEGDAAARFAREERREPSTSEAARPARIDSPSSPKPDTNPPPEFPVAPKTGDRVGAESSLTPAQHAAIAERLLEWHAPVADEELTREARIALDLAADRFGEAEGLYAEMEVVDPSRTRDRVANLLALAGVERRLLDAEGETRFADSAASHALAALELAAAHPVADDLAALAQRAESVIREIEVARAGLAMGGSPRSAAATDRHGGMTYTEYLASYEGETTAAQAVQVAVSRILAMPVYGADGSSFGLASGVVVREGRPHVLVELGTARLTATLVGARSRLAIPADQLAFTTAGLFAPYRYDPSTSVLDAESAAQLDETLLPPEATIALGAGFGTQTQRMQDAIRGLYDPRPGLAAGADNANWK